jgi:Xaa-Pro aminopeptidase
VPEATDRRIGPGDLVFVDTDAVGIEGCFFCVSRTFGVGEPTSAQRATYTAAQEWITATEELVGPRHHVWRAGRASARHPGAVRRPAL